MYYKFFTVFVLITSFQHVYLTGGGGYSHWKVVWRCAAVMTPFFQSSWRSLAYQLTLNVPISAHH